MLAAVLRENEGSSHRLASTCSASSNVPFPPSSMKSVLFSHQQKLALLFCKGGQRVPIFESVTSVFMETMLKLRALEERFVSSKRLLTSEKGELFGGTKENSDSPTMDH